MIGAIFVKFSQLILMKVTKIVATRCQILRLKCTKFNFGWGFAPDPAGELTPLLLIPQLDLRERREWSEGRGPLFFLRIYTHGAGLRHTFVRTSSRCDVYITMCAGAR